MKKVYLEILKLKFKPCLLCIFLNFMVIHTYAQDPQFSQYYASLSYLNPALTGVEKDIYFGINYRSQWNSLESSYTTGQFSFNYPLMVKGSEYKHVGGLGLSVFNDVTGINGEFETYGVSFSGAYNVTLNRDQMLFMGLQAGIIQKNIDLSNLRWGSQYDAFIGYDNRITPSVGEVSEQNNFPVFNAGILWHYEKVKRNYIGTDFKSFAGLAVSNLNNPDESLLQDGTSPLPLLYKLHGGMELTLSHYLKFSPNFLVMRQNSRYQINTGAYITITKFGNPYARNSRLFDLQVGAWYRFKDSFIFMLGADMRNFNVGFSYDLNTSTLRYNNLVSGTYEISMAYRIVKGKGLRRFSTPLM